LPTTRPKIIAKLKQRIHNYDVAKHWFKGDAALKQAKTLTPTELRRVLDYIATRPHAARNRAMVLMTFWAGMRVGEVAALRLRDVTDADGAVRAEIVLTPEQTKGNSHRTVYLNERLRKELATYIAQTHFINHPRVKLFYTQKRQIDGFTANTLTQYFHYLYKGAGIAGASSHSGRRSFITNLANKGISVRVLAEISGHRSITTTQKYIEVNDEQKRRAVELV
jgi:integrase/recombinase XerD